MFKNTSAVIVLDKYAERGRYFIGVYSSKLLILFRVQNAKYEWHFFLLLTFAFDDSLVNLYIAVTFYLVLYVSPIILDFVDPLNETRPKMYIMINVEYGVDADKYYWLILGHQYIVTLVVIGMLIAMETMYFLWTVHACSLFEVVRCVYFYI